jgi:DNA-binding response OmpR family regulator
VGEVLIVEDEALVAMLLEDWLSEFGFESRVCATVSDAIAAATAEDFELAILDVNLGGSFSYPIADALIAHGVPFAFATGYGQRGVKETYAAVPVISKPIERERLRAVVEQLRCARGGGDCGDGIHAT